MNRKFLITGSLAGAIAVMLGAFGAHGLKKILEPDLLQVFETAVKYQFYHAFALIAVGVLSQHFPGKALSWSGRLFTIGIFLFSGSLYLLCFIMHQQINANWVGAITPLGGVCFIAGWLFMAWAVAQKSSSQ